MPELGQAPRTAVIVSGQVVRELVGLCGALLAGYGAWLHYPPAGFMVGGGIMVGLAALGTVRGGS